MGGKVKRWKLGDEVVAIHCQSGRRRRRGVQRRRLRCSLPASASGATRTPDGSFAQCTCRVQSRQLLPRPQHLTWEEAACYTLTLATAYRMLFGHKPHELKPGQNVAVWGASRGAPGVFAVQLAAVAGANAIGVVSGADKREFLLSMKPRPCCTARNSTAGASCPRSTAPSSALTT
ncbi:hypothetical protein ACRAWD_09370 [Caulobacter segnis]